MRIFDLANTKDKETLKKELGYFEKVKGDDEFRKLMSWQLGYCKELVSRNNGVSDKVMIYGAADKFTERIEKPSPVQLSEIYDIENDVKKIKQQGYEIVGGLGGFSFNNGRYAGELIFLPGASCMRVHIDNGKNIAMMVAPMNIYPLCIFTARRETEGDGDQTFIVVFEKGEKVTIAMEKIEALVANSKKTITGVISGTFSDLTGYIFSSASPKTVLKDFALKESKNLFLYQTLLAGNIKGFPRAVHTHGFEAAKFGEPHAFGGHLHNATVNFAIGVFVVAGEVEKK
ncbi:hypothetical protein J4450_07965 [Candidatus Micrarchaeota archaeon]|nr:hypothetical protein [Candidatus Micrarchaeota archaeon]